MKSLLHKQLCCIQYMTNSVYSARSSTFSHRDSKIIFSKVVTEPVRTHTDLEISGHLLQISKDGTTPFMLLEIDIGDYTYSSTKCWYTKFQAA